MGKKKSARGRSRNDLRHGKYGAPVQGSGVQNISYNALSAPAVPVALAVLPPVPPEFTGREAETDDLLALLAPREAASPGGTAMPVPTTAVVTGLPGVGKTTLAVGAAHRAVGRGWFTGVQMINLRGYDQTPVPPEQALDALLRSLGVPPDHIPPTRDERANMYRSQLDAMARQGERLLIVADNASGPDQVQPLLPGTPVHRVLVTSRHTLTGLGARFTDLRTLPLPAAIDLVRRALYVADPNDRRVDDDPEGAENLARACGLLPLALQITASLLIADPGQPLSERAELLTAAGSRLAGLDDGSRAVRAAFEQSLRLLTPQQADLFRLLSLNPGPHISTKAASLLSDRTETDTRKLLNDLAGAHLLERVPSSRDRWQIHDLLRDYAAEQATDHAQRSRDVRRRYQQAQTRLRDHYLRTVTSVNVWLEAEPGQQPSGLFASEDEAMAWMDAEHSVLSALGHIVTNSPAAGQLATALAPYMLQRRYFDFLYTLAVTIRDVAQETGDRNGQALGWEFVGSVAQEQQRFDEALSAYSTARDIYQELGKRAEEAEAWDNIGTVLQELRRHEESLVVHSAARDIYRELGKRAEEADTWNSISIDLQELKRFDEALDAAETARGMAEETGDQRVLAVSWNQLASAYRGLGRHDESLDAADTADRISEGAKKSRIRARAWNNRGLTLQELERYDEAIAAFDTALRHYREARARDGEGIAWNNLGTAHRGAGHHADAIDAGYQAGRIFTEIGDQYLAGEAYAELAATLAAADREPVEIADAWANSADAYTAANAEERAAASRAKAAEIRGE
ncbi:hypothetical protein AQ490_12920 [Wenjunlia vitaminophila]|uniref:NB-ARC domain-containing protein n=1 Tax=Wenjunlia vitaminophila TaxID=76728 RepID=A0A0T6LXX2_WENVI|nr:tetratricopeptide repeat protein [Wenjunlia vitaminophila]KRV50854.1 hypothetical protein AQ490_12920 [Wenjunlia vitaminophila]